ncbi:PEP-CTERM sorting domain-containing protein [Accumulibacter sp.]|uniref:PEP-CTERM sorting domain-containing protein n=1 Tax=Accumulibacter sp. TaxID=2053492 RepID=UPI0035B17190
MFTKSSIALFASMLACASAQAAPVLVLDQQNVVPGSTPTAPIVTYFLLGDGPEFAQTFTVGVGGVLAQVDLQLARFGSTPLVLDIRRTSAGVPNSTILSTLSINPSTVPAIDILNVPFTSITLGSAEIPVLAGDVLAIALSQQVTGNDFFSWYSTGDLYSGGSAYFRDNSAQPFQAVGPIVASSPQDFGFRTYVRTNAVPEPGALGLAALALALAGRVRRRHAVTAL